MGAAEKKKRAPVAPHDDCLPELVKPERVAEWIGASPEDVIAMTSTGEIPPNCWARFGDTVRFFRHEVEAWIANGRLQTSLDLATVSDVARELGLAQSTAYRVTKMLKWVSVGRNQLRVLRGSLDAAKEPSERARLMLRVSACHADRRARETYGLSEGERDVLLEQQGCRCAICHRELTRFGLSVDHACVDHCHETGAVRGILCGRCNRGIGLLRDDSAAMRRAAEYVERSSAATKGG
jgi:hypothetical protein